MFSSPESNESRELITHLVSGLTFHYADTLRRLPLNIALQAMAEAWRRAQAKR